MINPCRCISLQNGTRVVGILQIVGAILVIIYLVVNIMSVNKKQDKLGESIPMDFIFWFIIAVTMAGFALFLGGILLVGASQQDAGKCKVWWYAMYLLTVMSVLSSLMYAINMGITPEPIVAILLNIYCLWVVYAFLEEIRLKKLPQPEEVKGSV